MSLRTQTIDYLEKRRDVILMVQKNQKLSKVLKRELVDLEELIEEWNLIW
jgi:hypothetical protein